MLDNDQSSGSDFSDADEGASVDFSGRTKQTALKSTAGHLPRKQLATKARRAVIPNSILGNFTKYLLFY